jgi:hypothetical protein
MTKNDMQIYQMVRLIPTENCGNQTTILVTMQLPSHPSILQVDNLPERHLLPLVAQ